MFRGVGVGLLMAMSGELEKKVLKRRCDDKSLV